jgi:hypothetical protein
MVPRPYFYRRLHVAGLVETALIFVDSIDVEGAKKLVSIVFEIIDRWSSPLYFKAAKNGRRPT